MMLFQVLVEPNFYHQNPHKMVKEKEYHVSDLKEMLLDPSEKIDKEKENVKNILDLSKEIGKVMEKEKENVKNISELSKEIGKVKELEIWDLRTGRILDLKHLLVTMRENVILELIKMVTYFWVINFYHHQYSLLEEIIWSFSVLDCQEMFLSSTKQSPNFSANRNNNL